MSDNLKELAERIADGILGTSVMGIAHRIALKGGQYGAERDLGGLCRSALIDRVHMLLFEHAPAIAQSMNQETPGRKEGV